jgi:hypothetical protein
MIPGALRATQAIKSWGWFTARDARRLAEVVAGES